MFNYTVGFTNGGSWSAITLTIGFALRKCLCCLFQPTLFLCCKIFFETWNMTVSGTLFWFLCLSFPSLKKNKEPHPKWFNNCDTLPPRPADLLPVPAPHYCVSNHQAWFPSSFFLEAAPLLFHMSSSFYHEQCSHGLVYLIISVVKYTVCPITAVIFTMSMGTSIYFTNNQS